MRLAMPHHRSIALALAVIAGTSAALAPWPALANDGAVPSYGGTLLQMVVSLALVCGLALVVLKFGLPRWARRAGQASPRLELLATLPVGHRRQVLLLRAVDRVIVVGASEAGMQLLTDLGESAEATSFAEVLEAERSRTPEDHDG